MITITVSIYLIAALQNSEELEKSHQAQQMTSQAEMKRELMSLQKKILSDAVSFFLRQCMHGIILVCSGL